MKLHSPEFERRIRRDVRRTIRSSPELKRECRRASKYRKQYQIGVLLRPGISVVLGILINHLWGATGHPATALAAITLWGAGFVFLHAQRLLTTLYFSTDIRAFMLLPIQESKVFRWEVQRFLRGALWSLLDFFAAFCAFGYLGNFTALQWFWVTPVAIVTWLAVIALAAVGVAWFPRVPYQLVSGTFMAGVFIIFVARDLVGKAAMALLDSAAPTLNLVVPTGWPVSLFQALSAGRFLLAIGFAGLTAGVIYSLRISFSRMLASYRFTEQVLPEAPDLVPGEQGNTAARMESDEERPVRVGPTAIEEIIQSRQFLVSVAAPRRGLFETWLWRWFSPREKTLAEFVFPNGLVLSRPWRNIFRNLAVTCLLMVGAGLLSQAAQYWLLALGLFVTVCQVLYCTLSSGRAFQKVPAGGVNIPLYAGYPIGFRELATMLLKYSLVQAPVILVFVVTASLIVSYLWGFPLGLGALAGVKIGVLLLASRPMFVVFGFSGGTNDTSRLRLSSLTIMACAVILGLGFAALGLGSFFVPGFWFPLLCLVGASVVAYAFFRMYGWFYHRRTFDLMSLPRQ